MRGRKPAPAAITEKKTAVRSKRAPKAVQAEIAQASASATGPQPPAWLEGEGLKVWQRLAPVLASAKLLSAADTQTFGRYCRNFARWLKMQSTLDADGEVYISESAHGTLRRANPAFLISDRLERQLLAAEDRFGLNPSERQRIFAARAQSGQSGDLFTPQAPKPGDKREDDAAAKPAEPAQPISSPIGMLN